MGLLDAGGAVIFTLTPDGLLKLNIPRVLRTLKKSTVLRALWLLGFAQSLGFQEFLEALDLLEILEVQ